MTESTLSLVNFTHVSVNCFPFVESALIVFCYLEENEKLEHYRNNGNNRLSTDDLHHFSKVFSSSEPFHMCNLTFSMHHPRI